MKGDDLIDSVAREMTTLGMRPVLWTSVMAELGRAPGKAPRRWLAPAACGALAIVGVIWFQMPSSRVAERAPMVAHDQPAPVAGSAIPEPAQKPAVVEAARSIRVRLPTPPDQAAPATVATTWATVPAADIPTLPPLAGPPPIEIEPITWSDVDIAPLNVELIGVKALEIEPLPSTDHSGV